MFDEADGSEGKEGFGRIRVELWRRSMEEEIWVDRRVEGGCSSEVDAIRTVFLQEKNELGGKEVREGLEDGDSFLVDGLNPSFSLVTMLVRSGVSDVSVEETEWCS